MVWHLENLQGFTWRTTCDSMKRVHFSILILQLFGSHCNNCYFWDTGLKICGLTNMLFQFLQTFFGLKKVDHVTNNCKRPIVSRYPKNFIRILNTGRSDGWWWRFISISNFCYPLCLFVLGLIILLFDLNFLQHYKKTNSPVLTQDASIQKNGSWTLVPITVEPIDVRSIWMK